MAALPDPRETSHPGGLLPGTVNLARGFASRYGKGGGSAGSVPEIKVAVLRGKPHRTSWQASPYRETNRPYLGSKRVRVCHSFLAG